MKQTMPTSQKGFSLVELMIALVLGLIIILGVTSVLLSNLQTYSLTQGQSQVQENGRFSLDIIGQDLRMAGGWGCSGALLTHEQATSGTLSAGFMRNTLARNASGETNAQKYVKKFEQGIEGHRFVNNAWSGDSKVTALFGNLAVDTTSDIVTIRRGSTFSAPVQNHSGGTITSPLGSQIIAASEPAFLITSDCHYGAIALTTVNGNNLLLGNNIALGRDFTDGIVGQAHHITYLIATSSIDPNTSALWAVRYNFATDQVIQEELITGVESMQVLYGIPAGNNTNTNYVAANAINRYDWEQDDWSNSTWRTIQAVRISLVSVSQDTGLSPVNQTIRIGNTNVVIPEGRLGQLFTSTVSIRNNPE
ncbi:PilW family protein [Nitrincola alkalisediminis]|uniref:PilW family protein n=1 Tax=Nitrincola alkalisediminis TaxID=1366656 RepID=UPI0018753293|nr:PilW family protein [Nitrincola alkalisediminis]